MTSSPRWRVALASAASAAMLVAAPLVGAQTAHAQPYPPPPPTLTLSVTTVRIGDHISFTATGFGNGQAVTALLDRRIVGRFTADPGGTVEGTLTVPRVHRGWHDFRLAARQPNRSLSTRIMVEPLLGLPSPSPSPTGPHAPGHHDGHGRQTGFDRPGGSDDGRGGPGALNSGSGQTGHRRSLAQTGDETALAYGGAAAGLIAAGGGTLLIMRRRRSS
jgi:LPXTG-motif cell wall-anchored protein